MAAADPAPSASEEASLAAPPLAEERATLQVLRRHPRAVRFISMPAAWVTAIVVAAGVVVAAWYENAIALTAPLADSSATAGVSLVALSGALAIVLMAGVALARRASLPNGHRIVGRAGISVVPGEAPCDADAADDGSEAGFIERAEAERALHASELRFRQLAQTLNDAVLVVDDHDCIAFANRAAQRIFGHAVEDLVGSPITLLQPERMRAAHRREWNAERVRETPGVEWDGFELVALHADGHEFPAEMSLSAMPAGERFAFTAIIRDMSERNRAAARLRESEDRFRALADVAPALIWMADPDGRYFYVNRAWLEYTGQALDQALGDGWAGALHPADRARAMLAAQHAVIARDDFNMEFRVRRRDGEYRWVLSRGVPRFDDDGVVIGYVGSGTEIHERVTTQRHIRRLTTLYAALTQANETIARVSNTQQLLQSVCAIAVAQGGFATAWCGCLSEDGQTLHGVAAAGDHATRYVDASFVTADPSRAQQPSIVAVREARHCVGTDRSGDVSGSDALEQPWRSTAALPLYREGRVVGVLTVYGRETDYFDDELMGLLLLLAGDISLALDSAASATKQREAEQALRQLNATLEERVAERTVSLEAANRELEAFSYSVSHDLRAPLRAISGFTDLLLDEHAEALPEGAQAHLARVKSASSRMARLINDLLDLSRVSRVPLQRASIDLCAIAQEIVDELRESDAGRSVDVTLPASQMVDADPGLARVVLANLLGNAWKFSAGRAPAHDRFRPDRARRIADVLRARQRSRLRHGACGQAVRAVPAAAFGDRIRGRRHRARAGAAHRPAARRLRRGRVGARPRDDDLLLAGTRTGRLTS